MSNYDLEIRVIDELAAALDNTADLPKHKTCKYRRPLIVIPEDCPLLTVALINKPMTPVTTNLFDAGLLIGVTWQIEAVKEAQTLIDNPKKSKELLEAMGKIQQCMRDLAVGHWSLQGGVVDEAYQLWPLQVDYMPPGNVETGLVEGYLMSVRVSVQEMGNNP